MILISFNWFCVVFCVGPKLGLSRWEQIQGAEQTVSIPYEALCFLVQLHISNATFGKRTVAPYDTCRWSQLHAPTASVQWKSSRYLPDMRMNDLWSHCGCLEKRSLQLLTGSEFPFLGRDWAERLSCHNADSRSKIIKWFKNSYWMSYSKWRVMSRSSSKALESPTLLFNVYRVLCREKSGRNMKLTTHLYLEPKLRMSGGIPSLPLYVFMTWLQKTLSICLFKLIHFYLLLFIYLFLFYLVIHYH